jgi:hypothetical protein
VQARCVYDRRDRGFSASAGRKGKLIAGLVLPSACERDERELGPMFLLFGLRGGRRGRIYLAARLVLVVAFLVVIFAFHPHGTKLDILEAVRFLLLIAIVGFAWLDRRKRTAAPVVNSD